MRAVVVERLEGPSALTVVDQPEPAEDPASVRIKVYAAGVATPDLLLTQGRFQIKLDPPFVPGQEVAGIVLDAPRASGFRAGQRVIATRFGGCWAETILTAPDHVFPLPDRLSMSEGAAVMRNYHAAYLALVRRAQLSKGEVLLVHGAAGGMGGAAVQIGKAAGARVIAVVSDDRKAAAARRLGADHTVLVGERWLERVRELTGRGVDVIFDPVTGDRFEDSLRALAPEGRFVVIGFRAGSIPQIALNRVLFRNISIVGAAWGTIVEHRPDLPALAHRKILPMIEAGFIKPLVGAEFPLAEAAAALHSVADRRGGLGKVVLTVREES